MRYMTVKNPDDTGSDGSIPGVESSTNSDGVVINEYPCNIDESVSYDTGETGENYKGSAELKGQLTDKVKQGHILEDEAGRYKVVTRPKLGKKWLRADLVKLS